MTPEALSGLADECRALATIFGDAAKATGRAEGLKAAYDTRKWRDLRFAAGMAQATAMRRFLDLTGTLFEHDPVLAMEIRQAAMEGAASLHREGLRGALASVKGVA